MSQSPDRVYKVRIALQESESVFAMMHRAITALEWLSEQGREEDFINVYMGTKEITFVLNNLETALLMRLSLE